MPDYNRLFSYFFFDLKESKSFVMNIFRGQATLDQVFPFPEGLLNQLDK